MSDRDWEATYLMWRGLEPALDFYLGDDPLLWRTEMCRIRMAASLKPELRARYHRDGVPLDPGCRS